MNFLLRAILAGLAMNGFIAANRGFNYKDCVDAADDLLKELNKESEKESEPKGPFHDPLYT